MGSTGRARLVSQRITQASSLTLSSDSIIFQDGEMCGANTAQLDRQIYARRRAARLIAAVTRSAIASDRDWKPLLENFKALPGSSAPYKEGFWKIQFATDILETTGDIDMILTFYENLPAPPTLHPCEASRD
jgi:hypothetical protein